MQGRTKEHRKLRCRIARIRDLSLLLSSLLLPLSVGCDSTTPETQNQTIQDRDPSVPSADPLQNQSPKPVSDPSASDPTNPADTTDSAEPPSTVSEQSSGPQDDTTGTLQPKSLDTSDSSTEGLTAEQQRELDPYGVKNPWEVAASKAFAEPSGATRLLPDANLWVDTENKRVVVDGYVTLDVGPLEMFACPVGTKEHESIVAVLSPAKGVHAALLAVGTVQGTPVSFVPEYRPATGQRVAIWLLWRDSDGTIQKARAQEWIQVTGEEKTLDLDWVFAGSSFWTDPESGEQYYQADSGDLVCVSNFSTAMLDLPVESSGSNSALVYQAYSDKIPPRGTPVRLVFSPIPLPSDNGGADTDSATQPGSVPPEDSLLDRAPK